jgi:hypothetical protein
MKKLAFGALFVGLLAACGGGSDSKIKIVDSSTIDTPMACNPLTQAGCATGEKCTWLLDALMPQYVGHVGCAPDGAANAGESCMYGAPGAAGFDNCKKGTVCSNYRGTGAGVCKTICDQQGGTPACDSTHVCVTYSGLFTTGDTTPAAGGVCDLACSPLTDNDFDGSGGSAKTGTTCGSSASVGCYGYPSYGTAPATGWSCTNDINFDQSQPTGLRHRVQCTEANNCADPGPTIYVNSCNQGYLPLLRESTAVSTAICIAMCEPLPCYTGNCGGTGNPNRNGKQPNRCKIGDRVAMEMNATEHCQYLWWREVDDQGNFLQSPTSDKMGFCMDFSKYQYDSNNDNTPDTNYPNCDTLGSGFGSGSDPTMPATYWGAADLGCVPSSYLPAMAAGKQGVPSDAMQRRQRAMDDMPRALYRRTVGERN